MVVDLNVPRRGGRRRRSSAMPTGWPCPAATSSSAPPERSLALSLSTALEKAATQTSVPAARDGGVRDPRPRGGRPGLRAGLRHAGQPDHLRRAARRLHRSGDLRRGRPVGRTRLIDNAHPDLRADRWISTRPRTSSTRSRRTTSSRGARRWSPRPAPPRTGPLAKQIGQLRRPTRSAWLVNVLARAEPERMAELLELGAALQQAQQRMAGDDLRRLSKERRTLIDSLSRRAVELGRRAGLRRHRRGDPGGQPDPAGRAGRPGGRRSGPGRTGAPGGELRRVRSGRPGLGTGRLAPGQPSPRAAGSRRRATPTRTAPPDGPRRTPPRSRRPSRRPRPSGRPPSRRRRRPPRPSRRPRRPPPEPTSWPMRSSRCGPGCGTPRPRTQRPGGGADGAQALDRASPRGRGRRADAAAAATARLDQLRDA